MPNTLLHKRGTTKPNPSDLLVGEIAINTAEGKLFTENDSGYIWEAGELLGTFSSATITYTVTVASKTSAHRYNGSGSNYGYKINGVFSPFLNLTPGNTYRFDQSDSSNSNHPLKFYLEADKTTLYSTGVTINGTAGQSGAYTEITINDTTPLILHYQCGFHGYMGNSVLTNSKTVNYNDLQNKPSLFSGNYNDLSNKPSLFSGDYDDLSNKPSLFSGSYNDLSNKPTIPTLTSQLTNDAGFITTGGGGIDDGDKGDIVVSNSGSTFLIDSGVIDNANVASNAAIQGTKISPNFGSQNITTLGAVDAVGITIGGNTPSLNFNDANDNPDFRFLVNSNSFILEDTTNSVNRFVVNSDGHIDITGNLDVGAGLDVTGVIFGTVSSANSTMMGLTANMGTNNNRSLLFKTPVTDSGSEPFRIQTSNSIQFDIDGEQTLFIDDSGQVNLHHDGSTDAKLSTSSTGVSVSGNITVTGTVDGVDIATRNTLFGGLTSSSGVLKNGVTATTQGSSDNTTKVATTAYVTTAISNLINNAPSALDTLKELSDALGSDANFSTTVTNSLATKLPLAGGTLTGTLNGTDADFSGEITVGGANTRFANNNLRFKSSGHAYIDHNTTGQDIKFRVSNSSTLDTTALTINSNGNIDVSGLVDGRDLASDGSKLDGIATGATNVTNNNQLTNGAGYITSADGGNAATLDNIDSSQFLRSDQNDTATGILTFNNHLSFSNDGDGIFLNGGGRFYKKVGTGLMIRLHTPNTQLQVENNSGTVLGTFWHSGNDGAGSGLDSDKLDGQQGSYYLDYNNFTNKPTIPTNNNQLTNGAGYITSAALAGASDGGNAALLDGIDSTQFLRADQDDTTTGRLTLNTSAHEKIVLAGSANPYIRWKEGSTDKAYIQWSSSGYFQFVNQESGEILRIKSGTNGLTFTHDGTESKVFHAGNDGSGSGLDSDKLDGQEGTYYLNYNNLSNKPTIPTNNNQLTNGAGYITNANGGNAATLDGIDSSQFVRSDANDTLSGVITLSSLIRDCLNFSGASTDDHRGISFNGRIAVSADHNDGYLRLNNASEFGNGVFTPGVIRADGGYKVGGTTVINGSGNIAYSRLTGTPTIPTNNNQLTNGAGYITSSQNTTGSSGSCTGNAATATALTSGNKTISGDLTVDNGTSTTLSVKCDNSGNAIVRAGGDGQGTGVFEVTQDNGSHGGGISYNGDGTPSFVSGETSDHITFYRIQAGTRTEVFHYPYNSNTVNFNSTPTVGGSAIWHSGNDGSGSGLDSDLLDGQQGSYYLNYNNLSNKPSIPAAGVPASGGTFTGDVTFSGGASAVTITSSDIGSNGSSSWTGDPGSSRLKIQAHSNRWYIVANSNADRIVQFRLNNSDKTWIETDGQIYHGSNGTGDKYWRQGNDGSGSGLDSDTVDGLQASSFVRSDTSDTMSGELNVTRNSGTTGGSAPSYSSANIELQTSSNHVPAISFHRGGYSATTLYENNGELYVNPWVARDQTGKLLTLNNLLTVDGSGSGIDADSVDGIQGANILTDSATQTKQLYIRNSAPTVYFRDTDHNAAMVHVNSHIFYVLRGTTDSTSWVQVNSAWPLEINLTNNDATFGRNLSARGNVTAYSSDKRLKENLKHIESPLDKVQRLNGYTFD